MTLDELRIILKETIASVRGSIRAQNAAIEDLNKRVEILLQHANTTIGEEMIFRKEPEEKWDDLKKFVLKLGDEQGLKMEYMSRSFKNNVKILSYDRCGMWDGEMIVYARDEEHFNEIIELARRNQ